MRRGMPRGRGGYNKQQHPQNQNPRQTTSGPLMTNHLLGLKDIDMELELLKRKREIIEQQQHILSSSYRQRNDYEQPMFSQSRGNRYDDYTRLYDNPREQYSGGGGGGSGSSGRKRSHIPVWENELPHKRFSAPSRGVKKAFGSRLGPPPQNLRTDFQTRPAAPKPYKRPAQYVPPQKKKEFNPTKVTKHSAVPPLMKLTTYPPAERKKLVTEAIASSASTVRAGPAATDVDSWILRADREPSRQVVGRMELALGSIMKDLKQANPECEELFKMPAAIRAMKQVVRDRVKTAMMGKLVSSSDNIKATYYDMFPSKINNDVVMKGLEIQKSFEFVTIKSDDPAVYFKKNMYRLMTVKLEEMTNKLEEIYMEKSLTDRPKKKNKNNQWKPRHRKEQPKVEADDAEPKTGESQTDVENTLPKTENKDSNIDKGEPQTDDLQEKEEGGQSKTDETVVSVEEQAKIVETITKTDETITSTDDSLIKTEGLASIENVSEKEVPKDSPVPDIVSTEQYKAFDKLMTNKMIYLIKKFTPAFVKVMDIDAMYRRTKAIIINEMKKKLEVISEVTPQTAQNAPAKKTEKQFLKPLQYYVKIIGKPSLPKRKAMEAFFENFQPRSVKKHRTMYNLLFVGFAEKEPYDKILAANGTVIGRNTLEIKVSERSSDKNPESTANSSVVSTESKKPSERDLNDSGSDVLGSQLDEQITDLLTSIRNSAELDSFSDDVVMNELPPRSDQNDLKTDDQTIKTGPNIVSDAALGDEVKETPENEDNDVVEMKDVPQNNDNAVEIIEVPQNNDNVVEIKDNQTENDGEAKTAAKNEEAEKKDTVEALKTDLSNKETPIRTSARLATPGGIRTRRMSKLE